MNHLISWGSVILQLLRICIYIPDKGERRIVVSRTGDQLAKDALDTAWRWVITDAISQGIIDESERFALHDLKRMGATNIRGTRVENQQASGYRSTAIVGVLDLEVSVVDAVEDDEL